MQYKTPSMEEILEVWFGLDEDQDFTSIVEERVKPLLEIPPEAVIESWNTCPEGRLALILLYDQGPRRLFYKTLLGNPQAYAYEKPAEELTTQFWEDGTHKTLTPRQQMFAFFPYHHAENAEYQERARSVFDKLVEEDESFEWIADSSANYNTIIQRFGRFPHRNLVLGRETTDDEWGFLVKEWYDSEELDELRENDLLPEKFLD